MGLHIFLDITLLSPVGGKLGDIFGRKAVVVVTGLINLVCGIGIAMHPVSCIDQIFPIFLFWDFKLQNSCGTIALYASENGGARNEK